MTMNVKIREDFITIYNRLCVSKEETSGEFNEFFLTIQTNDHPLQNLLSKEEIDEKFLLISRSQSLIGPAKKHRASSTSSTEADQSQSVIGSPLKLEEFSPVKATIFEDECGNLLHPVTIKEARQLLSLFISIDNSADFLLPVYVLCDGKDKGNTVMMSAITQTNKINTRFKTVTCQLVTKKDKSILNTQHSNIKEIQQNSPRNSVIQGKAIYDILDNNDSHLELHISWDYIIYPLSTPSLLATANAHINISIGDECSNAHSMYQNLSVLKTIASGLEDNQMQFVPRKDGTLNINQQIKKFIADKKQESVPSTGMVTEKTDNREGDDKFVLNSISIGNRTDLDSTEELWEILKDCKSYSELLSGLQIILEVLNRSEVQLPVHRSNKTPLAELIRSSYRQSVITTELKQQAALLMLVEIGLDKITRDYIFTFLGNNFVMSQHIEYYVSTQCSMKERINRLLKLQYILEVVVLLENYLNLSTGNTRAAARQILQYYEKNDLKEKETLIIPIEAKNIITSIKNLSPRYWKQRISDKEGNLNHQCDLSLEQPHSYLTVMARNQNEKDHGIQEEYYLTTINCD